MNEIFVVVTGLPASGKSTVAKQLASSLGYPLLDKDDYLEILFQQRGVGDTEHRQALSREADQSFIKDALLLEQAVLVSHWKPLGVASHSGTPVEALVDRFTDIVEINCLCSIEVAAQRFKSRQRHAGHLDQLKSYAEVVRWMTAYQQWLPINIGTLAQVDTSIDVPISHIDAICRKLQSEGIAQI